MLFCFPSFFKTFFPNSGDPERRASWGAGHVLNLGVGDRNEFSWENWLWTYQTLFKWWKQKKNYSFLYPVLPTADCILASRGGRRAHGKHVPSRGCDRSVRRVLMMSWSHGEWARSSRGRVCRAGKGWEVSLGYKETQVPSLCWGAGPVLLKPEGTLMDLSSWPRIKWSNLILLSWNVPECVSSDFSCLKSNPLKPKYHF